MIEMTEEEHHSVHYVPFFRGMLKRLAKICICKGVRAVFRHMWQLYIQYSLMSKSRHRYVDKRIGYQIPCGNCDQSKSGNL
jgi:hypothetical protein